MAYSAKPVTMAMLVPNRMWSIASCVSPHERYVMMSTLNRISEYDVRYHVCYLHSLCERMGTVQEQIADVNSPMRYNDIYVAHPHSSSNHSNQIW